MNKSDTQDMIANILCSKEPDISCKQCYAKNQGEICKGFSKCRVEEKTEDQLKYIISPIDENIFLSACAGSGKTEVVGMKSAYEIKKWSKNKGGIAILTFTNNATDVIKDRIYQFNSSPSTYPHFIGTVSSFIHQYIAQAYGYKHENYISKSNDHSFKIIDKEITANNKSWLNGFKCKYEHKSKSKKIVPVYANNIYLDNKNKCCHLKIGKLEYCIEKRNKNFNGLLEDKYNFLKHGFANYEDMNNIAYKILVMDSKVCSLLSKKFPLIIIDECQDLSWIELQIFDKLMEAGSNLHFAGDINQSIFEFKKVYPKDISEFIKDFKKMRLKENFRSCSKIVGFSNRLVPLCDDVASRFKEIYECEALLYIEYKDEKEAIESYNEIISSIKSLDRKKCCIIAKPNLLIDKLLNRESGKNKSEINSALQLWKENSPVQKQKALELFGREISKLFNGEVSKKNYYCPKSIESPFKWRLYLKSLLNEIINNTELMNTNITYSEWYKVLRTKICVILKNQYDIIKNHVDGNISLETVLQNTNFRTPQNIGKLKLTRIMNDDKKTDIKVVSIHDSKGCTYESTMVVSSKTTQSDGGHWKKHWLTGTDEEKRLGYVASTRAQYQLVWAVPTLTKEDRGLLESYGFKDAKSFK